MAENGQQEHLEVPSQADSADIIPLDHVLDDPPSIPSGRPVRTKRLTWKLLDRLPTPPSSLPDHPISEVQELPATSTPDQHQPSYLWKTVHTIRNTFGMYCEYPNIPTHNPDDTLTLANLTESSAAPQLEQETSPIIQGIQDLETPITSDSEHEPENANANAMYAPFANSSIHGIMNWMWSGSAMKSLEEVSKLVRLLKSADFKKEDIEGFDIRRETAVFDSTLESKTKSQTTAGQDISSNLDPVYNEGWHDEVKIQVPDSLTHTSDTEIPLFSIPGLHY